MPRPDDDRRLLIDCSAVPEPLVFDTTPPPIVPEPRIVSEGITLGMGGAPDVLRGYANGQAIDTPVQNMQPGLLSRDVNGMLKTILTTAGGTGILQEDGTWVTMAGNPFGTPSEGYLHWTGSAYTWDFPAGGTGEMVWPGGSGIPIVVSGTPPSWGTTLAPLRGALVMASGASPAWIRSAQATTLGQIPSATADGDDIIWSGAPDAARTGTIMGWDSATSKYLPSVQDGAIAAGSIYYYDDVTGRVRLSAPPTDTAQVPIFDGSAMVWAQFPAAADGLMVWDSATKIVTPLTVDEGKYVRKVSGVLTSDYPRWV